MASSYISNALQINFDSVLEITDNAEMVSMFKTLESTGLKGFLGCPSVLYERELEQFYDTAMVKEGDITCEVSGKVVVISEDRFAGMFGLPTEGLVNLSEEMVDKTLKKAKGFAAQLCVLLKSDPTVTMGEAKTFIPLKILSAKTVKTYIATNETIDARGKADEPGVAKIAKSKKRPIATGMELADVIPTVEEKTSVDEAMTLEEILLTIPDGCSLPSTTGEVTKIQLGKSISIPGVDEGDWYKASLPKIPAADKGKAPLLERDPIKGIPPKENFFSDSCKY
ncbi:hypothetical protein F511_37820 [Dorcoceras hygrometricum]|uniref:Dystroglycan-like n=1 Tax=Dorcoceras hygrometricum TaxID=472368 RepID=A0A2Z7BP27_9LAMI|nr:hypothetical protein F511_37820 [Dorcoceras hygrometricum]